jgi:hypothetical protein
MRFQVETDSSFPTSMSRDHRKKYNREDHSSALAESRDLRAVTGRIVRFQLRSPPRSVSTRPFANFTQSWPESNSKYGLAADKLLTHGKYLARPAYPCLP